MADAESAERRTTYVALSGAFMALFAAFAQRESKAGKHIAIRPFDLLLLGLATFRASRLVAYDKIASTYRAPFTQPAPDISGTGKTTVPKGDGARHAVGELIACPVCNGTWIAAALVYGMKLLPGPTRAFMAIMAAAGLSELLGSANEALQWTGEAARRRCTVESERR